MTLRDALVHLLPSVVVFALVYRLASRCWLSKPEAKGPAPATQNLQHPYRTAQHVPERAPRAIEEETWELVKIECGDAGKPSSWIPVYKDARASSGVVAEIQDGARVELSCIVKSDQFTYFRIRVGDVVGWLCSYHVWRIFQLSVSAPGGLYARRTLYSRLEGRS